MARSNSEPKNGDLAKDEISGFQGIVVAESQFLYGCRQVLLAPQAVDGNKMLDAAWFDLGRVKVLETGVVKPPESAKVREGGLPMASAPLPRSY